MSLEDVECFLIKKGHDALRRQRQPGGEGARPQPQRALPTSPALRAVSSGFGASAIRDPASERSPAGAPPLATYNTSRRMNSNSPREPRLSHDRRILLMAFASAAPGAVISLIFLWTGDYTPKVQWTLSRPDRDGLPGLRVRVARAGGAAAADAVQPAGRARRRRLLDPRPRRPRRRPAGRGDDRGQRAGRNAAPPAPRRARSDHAAPQGDGGDRRRGLHLRRAARAEVREPRRGPASQPAVGAAPRPARQRSRPRRLPRPATRRA